MRPVFPALLFLFILSSCHSRHELKAEEGFVPVKGGKVWYRIIGEGDAVPVVLLHGGPGFPSYYMKPIAALSVDRPVIFIDQLGCGRSDRISDTSLMNVGSFVEELEQVRKALGLEKFYLYGHSWGTMLGMDYYLKYPSAVKAMVIGSPCLSAPRWEKDADTLIATLPDSIQTLIRDNEKKKTYDSPDYQRAIAIYYDHFLSSHLAQSPDWDSTIRQGAMNIYEHMWGPSEFTATGNLKDYDRLADLPSIKVPVLFLTGEHDEARPSTVRYCQSLVPGAQFALIPNAGHLTMLDNPAENIRVVSGFLNGLEK